MMSTHSLELCALVRPFSFIVKLRLRQMRILQLSFRRDFWESLPRDFRNLFSGTYQSMIALPNPNILTHLDINEPYGGRYNSLPHLLDLLQDTTRLQFLLVNRNRSPGLWTPITPESFIVILTCLEAVGIEGEFDSCMELLRHL